MPVYEYQCDRCGERIQRLEQVGADYSGEPCPSCGKGTMKKGFSSFGTVTVSRSDGASCAPEASRRFR